MKVFWKHKYERDYGYIVANEQKYKSFTDEEMMKMLFIQQAVANELTETVMQSPPLEEYLGLN